MVVRGAYLSGSNEEGDVQGEKDVTREPTCFMTYIIVRSKDPGIFFKLSVPFGGLLGTQTLTCM